MNFNDIIDKIFKKYNFNGFPIKYKEKLISICEQAHSIFGSNLQSITLGGSGGKNNIIVNWSDLDIYIVLYNYNQEEIKKFYLIDSTSDIHIGTTFYTINEVLNDMIDGKTIIMIYEKYAYNFNPTLYGNNLFIEKNFNDVVLNDRKNLSNILQQVRRICLDIEIGKSQLSKSNIKKLLVLLKCILSQNNIFAYGYVNVFNLFNKLYVDKINIDINLRTGFDIKEVIKDINNLTRFNNRYVEYCMLVNNFVINMKEIGE